MMRNEPMKNWRQWNWSLIWVLVLVMALWSFLGTLIFTSCSAEAAEVHRGTVGFDYRNRPLWKDYIGFQYAVISPRAYVQAESLWAHETIPVAWVQPFVCHWEGRPAIVAPYDNALWQTVQAFDAVVKDTTGQWASISGHDISACYPMDFSVEGFPDSLAHAVAKHLAKFGGVLWDYGCKDLAWAHSLRDVDPDLWPAWTTGYLEYRQTLRELLAGKAVFFCQCSRWGTIDSVCDGLALEKVGWTLNPFQRTWDMLHAHGEYNMIMYMGEQNDSGQKLAAGMSLLTETLYSWRPWSDMHSPNRNPEHFDLYIGDPKPYTWEREKGVYQRHFSHGLVIVNMTDRWVKYGSRQIAPMSSLVIQTRDRNDGKYGVCCDERGKRPWRTNQ